MMSRFDTAHSCYVFSRYSVTKNMGRNCVFETISVCKMSLVDDWMEYCHSRKVNVVSKNTLVKNTLIQILHTQHGYNLAGC